MLKEGYSYYNYGIDEVVENSEKETYMEGKPANKNLLILKYGGGKKFYFRKADAYKLLQRVLGQKFLKAIKCNEKTFNKYVNETGYVDTLNTMLKGRALIFVTEFESYLEFLNGGQNREVGLTGMDIDGKLLAEQEKELFLDDVSFDEIYRYTDEESEAE